MYNRIIFFVVFFLYCTVVLGQNNCKYANNIKINYYFKKCNYLNTRSDKNWDSFIGARLLFGGVGLIMVDAVFLYAYGERLDNNTHPVNIPAQLKDPLAISGIVGLCSLFVGGYVWSRGNLRDQERNQRYSMTGSANQIGIAYNFR